MALRARLRVRLLRIGQRSSRLVVLAVMAGLSGPPGASAQAAVQSLAARSLRASLDSAARAHVESEIIPGVSVAVVRAGETLLQRGYGYVDIEWGVETPPYGGASYEIGSVTKQFTAVAIMVLVEEGKVDLGADFTEYIDFDTQGRTVPVRRLLDHTSGIKGYTEMDVFEELTPRKLPRDTLVRVVEREPFEFEPGTAQIYNNSAFFLLGLIVEAVSGQSYEDFVQERLFVPAGMDDSYYCSEALVRENRAHGYDAVRPDMVIRARYLDHTWPYAAGSLCSTVADLVRWNESLHGGRLLGDEAYTALTTPEPLLDGTPIRYSMGLQVSDEGRRVISHGGGINGFLSMLEYYPDEDLTIVVLQNATGPIGPGNLTSALVDLVMGPEPEPEPLSFERDYDSVTGSYRGAARGETMEVVVSVEDGALAIQGSDDEEPIRPSYRGGLRWDRGNTRFIFVEDGAVATELRVDSGGGHYVLRRMGG